MSLFPKGVDNLHDREPWEPMMPIVVKQQNRKSQVDYAAVKNVQVFSDPL
jgi:hypothetical protein